MTNNNKYYIKAMVERKYFSNIKKKIFAMENGNFKKYWNPEINDFIKKNKTHLFLAWDKIPYKTCKIMIKKLKKYKKIKNIKSGKHKKAWNITLETSQQDLFDVRDDLLKNKTLKKYYDGWGMDIDNRSFIKKLFTKKELYGELFFYDIPYKTANNLKKTLKKNKKIKKISMRKMVTQIPIPK